MPWLSTVYEAPRLVTSLGGVVGTGMHAREHHCLAVREKGRC